MGWGFKNSLIDIQCKYFKGSFTKEEQEEVKDIVEGGFKYSNSEAIYFR